MNITSTAKDLSRDLKQMASAIARIPAEIKKQVNIAPRAATGGDEAQSALRLAIGEPTVTSLDELVSKALQ